MSINRINNSRNTINLNLLTNVEKKNKLLSNNFADYIKKTLNKINITQKNAKKNSQDFILEKPGVSLSNVMIDLQKASITMHLAVQLRNKIVSSYQEIMNMQV
ncbi:flagellar hook-basal body complex protein FliE [Buchnera aphidicola]|uniref:flagellar hook-basal body complex protein FliE n=1 Tax=Buchnera aphidicola TaxID=9 RepID=UPI003464E196